MEQQGGIKTHIKCRNDKKNESLICGMGIPRHELLNRPSNKSH